MEELTQDEIEQRVAVLKKFKSLLEKQREKFREYLEVLEKQQTGIENEDDVTITRQAELEKQIVGHITNLQKVIKPMEKLYQDFGSPDSTEIPVLKTDLEDLQRAVSKQNEKNQQLLMEHMMIVQEKLTGFSNPKINPYVNKSSIYAKMPQTASILDVEG